MEGSSSAAALEEDDYEPNFGARCRQRRLAAVRHRRPARAPASRAAGCSALGRAHGPPRRRRAHGVQQSQPARPAAFSPSKHYFRRAASWVRMEAELGEAGMEKRHKLKSVLEQCARCERIYRVPMLVVLLESVGASEAGDDVRAMVSDETAQMEATVSVDVLREQAGKIVGGATMYLEDVGVLTLAPWAHHLIIHGDCVKSVEAPAAKQSEHAAAPAAASVSAAATAHREPPPPQPRPPPHVPPPPQPGAAAAAARAAAAAARAVAAAVRLANRRVRGRARAGAAAAAPTSGAALAAASAPAPAAAPPLAAAAAAGGKRPRDEEPPAPPAAAPPPPPANFMLPPPPPPAMPAGRVGSARINRAVAAAPPPARVASRVTAPMAAAPAPTPEPAAAVLDPSRISQSTADDLDDDEW